MALGARTNHMWLTDILQILGPLYCQLALWTALGEEPAAEAKRKAIICYFAPTSYTPFLLFFSSVLRVNWSLYSVCTVLVSPAYQEWRQVYRGAIVEFFVSGWSVWTCESLKSILPGGGVSQLFYHARHASIYMLTAHPCAGDTLLLSHTWGGTANLDRQKLC